MSIAVGSHTWWATRKPVTVTLPMFFTLKVAVISSPLLYDDLPKRGRDLDLRRPGRWRNWGRRPAFLRRGSLRARCRALHRRRANGALDGSGSVVGGLVVVATVVSVAGVELGSGSATAEPPVSTQVKARPVATVAKYVVVRRARTDPFFQTQITPSVVSARHPSTRGRPRVAAGPFSPMTLLSDSRTVRQRRQCFNLPLLVT